MALPPGTTGKARSRTVPCLLPQCRPKIRVRSSAPFGWLYYYTGHASPRVDMYFDRPQNLSGPRSRHTRHTGNRRNLTRSHGSTPRRAVLYYVICAVRKLLLLLLLWQTIEHLQIKFTTPIVYNTYRDSFSFPQSRRQLIWHVSGQFQELPWTKMKSIFDSYKFKPRTFQYWFMNNTDCWSLNFSSNSDWYYKL